MLTRLRKFSGLRCFDRSVAHACTSEGRTAEMRRSPELGTCNVQLDLALDMTGRRGTVRTHSRPLASVISDGGGAARVDEVAPGQGVLLFDLPPLCLGLGSERS